VGQTTVVQRGTLLASHPCTVVVLFQVRVVPLLRHSPAHGFELQPGTTFAILPDHPVLVRPQSQVVSDVIWPNARPVQFYAQSGFQGAPPPLPFELEPSSCDHFIGLLPGIMRIQCISSRVRPHLNGPWPPGITQVTVGVHGKPLRMSHRSW